MADKLLSEITPEDITAAHLAIEDQLIWMRDDRIGILNRANGLVVKEKDGSPSPIIRIGTRDAIELAIRTILEKTNG